MCLPILAIEGHTLKAILGHTDVPAKMARCSGMLHALVLIEVREDALAKCCGKFIVVAMKPSAAQVLKVVAVLAVAMVEA